MLDASAGSGHRSRRAGTLPTQRGADAGTAELAVI